LTLWNKQKKGASQGRQTEILEIVVVRRSDSLDNLSYSCSTTSLKSCSAGKATFPVGEITHSTDLEKI
jgi:hypothetical protein